jgi:ribosomal protein S18 acetylase RimI-like enzyme
MEIIKASLDHVEKAVSCLVNAFANDPQVAYFFPVRPEARPYLVKEFFVILLEARLKLGMPVLQLMEGDSVLGVVMGYDTRRPEWPPSQAKRLSAFESVNEGLVDRFTQADKIMEGLKPASPHYYLGVVGMNPTAQGRGKGRVLVDAFLSLSDLDTLSDGTFLETANPHNLAFYQHFGFEIIGQGSLDNSTSLWCLFRPKP